MYISFKNGTVSPPPPPYLDISVLILLGNEMSVVPFDSRVANSRSGNSWKGGNGRELGEWKKLSKVYCH